MLKCLQTKGKHNKTKNGVITGIGLELGKNDHKLDKDAKRTKVNWI